MFDVHKDIRLHPPNMATNQAFSSLTMMSVAQSWQRSILWAVNNFGILVPSQIYFSANKTFELVWGNLQFVHLLTDIFRSCAPRCGIWKQTDSATLPLHISNAIGEKSREIPEKGQCGRTSLKPYSEPEDSIQKR